MGNAKRMRTTALLAAIFVVTVLAVTKTQDAAAAPLVETHVFEPVRSLAGDCRTSRLDEVPDPNCPGGPNPPGGAFFYPTSIRTDPHGDIYVASLSLQNHEGYVQVFDPNGHFITDVVTPQYPSSVGVDSEGNIIVGGARVHNGLGQDYIYVYHPSSYDPATGNIAYEPEPQVIIEGVSDQFFVDPATDHILVGHGDPSGPTGTIHEYSSVATGASLIREFGKGTFQSVASLAVDDATGEVFAAITPGKEVFPAYVNVYDSAGSLIRQIKGVPREAGIEEFSSPFAQIGLAVEEETGDLFVSDLQDGHTAVFEISPGEELVSELEHGFIFTQPELGFDNSDTSANKGYLYVPSGPEGPGHAFAFAPKPKVGPPIVEAESVAQIGVAGVLLEATINPNGLSTHYYFQYLSRASYEAAVEESGIEDGFEGATTTPVRAIPTGQSGVRVTAAVGGLVAGGRYVFRLVGENSCEEGTGSPPCIGTGKPESFRTFPAGSTGGGGCPNEPVRAGPSANLPDCRAYELVTPSNTNSQTPQALGNGIGAFFSAPPVSSDGDSVSFLTIGGPIGSIGGTGAFWGDPYLARRTESGWVTTSAGFSGGQSVNPVPGSASADQGYSFQTTDDGLEGEGGESLVVDHEPTTYLRTPGGSFELLGEGTEGVDPGAKGLYIAEGGTQVVFGSSVHLDADSPPTRTYAIYERAGAAAAQVVSLLPDGTAGANVRTAGISENGEVVAFESGPTSGTESLYVHSRGAETLEVAGPGSTFAGFGEDGRTLIYLNAGNLFRFQTETAEVEQLTSTGDAVPVNVSSDGGVVYFVSTKVIKGALVGPGETKPKAKLRNLYALSAGETHFIGILTATDVEGEKEAVGRPLFHGLGLWTEAVGAGVPIAADPSRTTANGNEMVFEARAPLTGAPTEGHREIYLYDLEAGTLACISCNATERPASANAELMALSYGEFTQPHAPANQYTFIPNLSANGRRIIFESAEGLVPTDTDGAADVYEWEQDGEGSCSTGGGCVSLISTGRNADGSYLFGIGNEGRDVLFRTTDILVGSDGEATASIYDARIEGGFPEAGAGAGECLGEACQPSVQTPASVTPASSTFDGPGNLKPARPLICKKGQLKKKGKCVKKTKAKKGKRSEKTHSKKASSKRRQNKKGRAGR